MSGSRRVAIYGGSFDPPHVCHVMATAWAMCVLPIDEVWWVPTWQHAFGKGLTAFAHRHALAEAAIAAFDSRVRVCTIEADLGIESRTWDTMNALRELHPDLEFSLLMGSDLLASTHRWKHWDDLVRMFPIHVIGRAGRGEHQASTPLILPDVSSSAVREALSRGDVGFVAPRVPSGVLELILANGWYDVPDA